jgi:hypothetical protein
VKFWRWGTRVPLVVPARRCAGRDQIGGKGFALNELAGRGVPIPPWIAVTADAADMVLAPFREAIAKLVRDVPAGDVTAARTAAGIVAELVRGARWPASLQRQLTDHLRRLQPGVRLAVRSSAAEEDSAAHSFAGQLATTLFVPREEVEAAVRECWASAFSERAILYRKARGLPADAVRIAVVIQEMVDSRVSGVAFTADPTTGLPSHLVVAGYGLGEGVVLDLVETDRYVREFDAPRWEYTVRSKTRRVVRRADASPGTEFAAVPAEDRERPALSEAQLESLADVLHRIEARAGCPQDVEWAWDHAGRLWILQARPITTLPPGELAIWDDSNIGESYPGLTLPLTYSYVRFVYERLFACALRQAGVSETAVAAARDALAHLVGIIRGRLYLNLAHFYRLFALVPGLEGSVRSWETAFGVSRHVRQAARVAANLWRRAIRPLLLLRTRFRLALRFLLLARDARRLQDGVDEMVRQYGDADWTARPLDELLATYGRINAQFLDMWSLLIFNDLFAVRFVERLAGLCGEEHDGSGVLLHHRLLSGLAGIESLAPAHSALRLAERVASEPALAQLFGSSHPAEEVWAELQRRPELAAFRADAARHLRRYGHRTVGELKLETITPADRPWELVSVLRNCLALRGPARAAEQRARDTTEAERQFRARWSDRPLRRMCALWVLEWSRRCLAIRENLSYARSRAYAVLRHLFRAVGAALARAGGLREAGDVFYLTLDDFEAYMRGSLPEAELAGMVELRRA